MAQLNTSTSIVDYLKSTGMDASFENRAKLAVETGVVKSVGDYLGSAEQNSALLSSMTSKSSTPSSPSAVTNLGNAGAYINANQKSDIAAAGASDVPTRSSSIVSAFRDLTGKSSIVPTTAAPTAPNFEQSYQNLRTQYGIGNLESQLTQAQAEAATIKTQFRTQYDAETGKPVALNVIEGRVSEEEKAANQRLSIINDNISNLTNQLTNANKTVETLMSFKKLDYDTAVSTYDREFSNNLQLFNVVKGLSDADMTQQERAQDNARSNLQIIYNSLKDSGGAANVSSDLAYTISKLELQAGLPTGFYQRITAENPQGKVLSTTTREQDGVKYADVLSQMPDGSLSTRTVKLGTATGGSSDLSESELLRGASASVSTALEGVKSDNGYVSVDDYKKARSAWVKSGFSRETFDKNFAREYLSPNDYTAADVDYVMF